MSHFYWSNRVISMDLNQSIVALKNVTFNEHFFKGIFRQSGYARRFNYRGFSASLVFWHIRAWVGHQPDSFVHLGCDSDVRLVNEAT